MDRAGRETCYVKGSVEAVLLNCTSFRLRQGPAAEMGETERRQVLDAASALGSKGRRCACSLPCFISPPWGLAATCFSGVGYRYDPRHQKDVPQGSR